MISIAIALIILALSSVWHVIALATVREEVHMISTQVQAVLDATNAVKAAIDAKLVLSVTLSTDDVNALGVAVTTLQGVAASLAPATTP